VGASPRLGLGELPSVDVGGELEVAYVGRRLRVEVHGETAFVQDTNPSVTGTYSSLRAAGGGARGCYGSTLGRFSIFGCGEVELDWMWGQGVGPGISPKSPSGGWATLGAGGAASVGLTRRVFLRALVLALAPLSRPDFITTTASGAIVATVFRPSAAWGEVGIGVEAIIF
jgi:hypothetical protein